MSSENLNNKQKKWLKAQAHTMRPVVQVGKEGCSPEWLEQLKLAIEKRELLKISVLANAAVDELETKEFLEVNSKMQVIQILGHVITVYCPAKKLANRNFSTQLKQLASTKE
ncbi:MAG: YhbY family RNA-binding protein [Liquorilactobacillus ghanensis]|uniref:YhbY family RNA-binding protein n=1 Tax=Liquorilactobacillus ghanensis TaxID=399370 RepID=UPI0039EBD0B2